MPLLWLQTIIRARASHRVALRRVTSRHHNTTPQVEVVGFMYWWGVTISGVSTIYILISVGLTVDYSAHIAHVYTHTTGSPRYCDACFICFTCLYILFACTYWLLVRVVGLDIGGVCDVFFVLFFVVSYIFLFFRHVFPASVQWVLSLGSALAYSTQSPPHFSQ